MKQLNLNMMTGVMSAVVIELCEANNTVTTLELKNELRRQFPKQNWIQKDVSDFMAKMAEAGDLSFSDNGTFRTYSIVKKNKQQKPKAMKSAVTKISSSTPKAQPSIIKAKISKISRSKALEMMKDNKGRFFTATFTDKKGAERVMNCQYLKEQGTPKLGYVKVKEAALMRSSTANPVKQINLQTLSQLKIGGQLYKVG